MKLVTELNSGFNIGQHRYTAIYTAQS